MYMYTVCWLNCSKCEQKKKIKHTHVWYACICITIHCIYARKQRWTTFWLLYMWSFRCKFNLSTGLCCVTQSPLKWVLRQMSMQHRTHATHHRKYYAHAFPNDSKGLPTGWIGREKYHIHDSQIIKYKFCVKWCDVMCVCVVKSNMWLANECVLSKQAATILNECFVLAHVR